MADDPYVYVGTSVLRNLPDIRTASQLREFESLVTFKRILELEYRSMSGAFDAGHLCSVHRYIFQDVYSWAGEFRTVDMGKEAHWFCRPEFISSTLADLLRKLSHEDYLRKTNLEIFVSRAAYYLGELNAIHPFREGNGRAQREFLREVALNAGYQTNWSRISRERMYSASEISFNTGNHQPLAQILSDITTTSASRD